MTCGAGILPCTGGGGSGGGHGDGGRWLTTAPDQRRLRTLFYHDCQLPRRGARRPESAARSGYTGAAPPSCSAALQCVC